MKIKWQKIVLAISIFLISMTVFHKYMEMAEQNAKTNISKITLSTFLDKVKNKQIKEATFNDDEVVFKLVDSPNLYKTQIPITMQKGIISKVYQQDVKVQYQPQDEKNNNSNNRRKKRIDSSALLNIVFDLIFFLIFAFILRSGMTNNRTSMMSMNKKNKPTKSSITFKDVAGIDAYKNEVMEVLDFLKNPELYRKYGAKIPKGLLLCGPPGTGKTLIAKAMAGEAGVPFYSVAGSDFVEMYVGVGASRVRELFKVASEYPAGIIFIDEVDAIGASRKNTMYNSNSEQANTLNALLVEMDGFNTNNIIVIAATNRVETLDEALLRPGRFDRIINVPLPDINGREKIINLVLSKIKMPYKLDVRSIARMTPGFSGADLTALINEAILWAIKQRESVLTIKLVEAARDKILHGIPDGREHSKEEIICTAYHEAGHAIIAHHFRNLVEPIFKLTIESHGNALGFLSCFPDSDKSQTSKIKYLANINVTLGGRAAEEIFFGKNNVTSGASSDFKQATKLANGMVRRWGMSDNGILVMDIYNQEEAYLISDKMKDSLYLEAKKIVDHAYQEVIEILKSYEPHMHSLVYYLMTNGTLYKKDIENILNGLYSMVGPLSSVNLLESNLLPADRQKIII